MLWRKIFTNFFEKILEVNPKYPVISIISYFLLGFGFTYLGSSLKHSDTNAAFLFSTLEIVGFVFMLSSMLQLSLTNVAPYIWKAFEGIWSSSKDENSKLIKEFVVNFRGFADKFEDTHLVNLKSNEKTNALFKESLENTSDLYRESLNELLHRIDMIRLDLQTNIEKERLQSLEYSDIPPKDYKVIKSWFTEIHDLNKKIEKEQEEIDVLKADTSKLAYETQKVLSILQDKVGAK